MLRKLILLFVLALTAVGQAQGVRCQPGEILVKFKPGTQIVQRAFHQRYGTKVIDVLPKLGVTRIKLPEGMNEEDALQKARKLTTSVVYAEKNIVYDYDSIPNDPENNVQYHLPIMHAPEAWDITIGKPTVVIAICDSGLMLNHEDLAPKVLQGTDTYDMDDDPTDDVGHGTFCAGLAAAATNNGKGISGVGYSCRLLPVRVGGIFGVPSSAAADGIIWAADHGANVINLSFGGSVPNQTMKDAIDYATNVKNIVVVAAAGNFDTTLPLYPAAYPNVISVGATDENDEKTTFSNYGSWVDVAAPGLDVFSTTANGSYSYASGTSFSSPIVAGVAGLLWSHAGPTATNTEIRSYIENSCDYVGDWLVYGRVNILSALNSVIQINRVNYDPFALDILTGHYGGGNFESVKETDGSMYFVIADAVSGLGFVSALQADFTVNDDPNDMNSLSVLLSATGPSRVTQFVYVWNWQTNQYEFLRSYPLNGTVTPREIQLGRPFERYIQPGTNTVRVLVRAVAQQRFFKKLTYQVDKLRLEAMVRTH